MTKNPSTKRPAPTYSNVCVLYDSSNGRIAHTHRAVSYGQGIRHTEEEVEAGCIATAKKLGHDVVNMKTLHVPSAEFKTGMAYRVYIHARQLVEYRPVPSSQAH